jgi:hypothetical protein
MSFGSICAARGYLQLAHFRSVALAQGDGTNAGALTTRVADGIAVITLGSARRISFDEEMGDALILDVAWKARSASDWGPQPMFGVMTPKQWGQLLQIHIDYHLKQFAA